jgi:hypothetical protein
VKFSILFPHLRPWIQGLDKVWPGSMVKPNFAYWEVLHILSLVMLGGCAILLGLRLIGYGLTEEKPSDLYRATRPWLLTGVIGIVVTGVLIGTANAERLYDSSAFLVKMLALLAGVILTFGAMRPIALADGEVSRPALIGGGVGLAVAAYGIWVLLTGGLITPGVFHILSAAALIVLFVTQGRLRLVYAGGVAVLLFAFWSATHVFIKAGDMGPSDTANVALSWITTAWIVGCALAQGLMGRAKAGEGNWFAKLIGYAVILVWVAGGAAGRWIAFA